MPLCVGLHGGVIAFGNALGNSIVEGMSVETDLTPAEQKAINDKANKLINLDKLGNIDEPMAEIAKNTTAGAEKEATNKINKAGQSQRDKFDADFEVAQVVREQKASEHRIHTISERQRIDADSQAYDKQYAQYRAEMDNQLEQSYQNGINRGGSAYLKGRQTSAIGGDFATEYDWKTLQADAETAKRNANRQMRYALDYGETNAIEVELNFDADFYFFGVSFGSSLTFDNGGALTWAVSEAPTFRGSTNATLAMSLSGGVVKGFGTKSSQLGTGVASSWFVGGSVSDAANKVVGSVAESSKFIRPEIGVFYESGYTLNSNYQAEFKFEGYGAEIGYDPQGKLSQINSNSMTSRVLEAPYGLTGGAEQERAQAIFNVNNMDTGAFGRGAYAMLNRFIFK